MYRIPTVAVQHPTIAGEWMLINESDFDPTKHTLVEAAPLVTPSGSPPELTPALARAEELQQIYMADGWQAIKAIATPLGIEKPTDGWDAAIPLIVAAEFPDG